MFDQQLQELRHEKWRLDGQGVHTLDAARAFIDSVGFCTLYPQKPAVLAPTFVGAYVGNDDKLPTSQKAFADPRAREAKHLMVRRLSFFLWTGWGPQSPSVSQSHYAIGILASRR